MSFLNQLKSQAQAVQSQQNTQQQNLEENTKQVELACRTVQHYLGELARHLEVLSPASPALSLDGKTPWPPMKLVAFRVDARRKTLRNKEVFDYLAMGWQIVPRSGPPVAGSVTVNFPPDLQRVESRLAGGQVRHERKELRHPEKGTLQAIKFDYLTEARASIMVTTDHDSGNLAFRLANVSGFGVQTATWPAAKIQSGTLDELAKLIVGEPSQFV